MRLAPLALCLLPLAAHAAPLTETRFAPGTACYQRVYDAAHLAAHPQQQVTSIAIGPVTSGPGSPGSALDLVIEVHVRGTDEAFIGFGYCDVGTNAVCAMEGDSGTFTLSAADNSAVLLQVGAQGMFFEGGFGSIEISGTTGDDRSFRIDPVGPGLCPY